VNVRRTQWIPGAQFGVLIGPLLALAFFLHQTLLAALAAAILLAVTFAWGYATRALRRPEWPALRHLQRHQYAIPTAKGACIL
jgi:hypothetical protein